MSSDRESESDTEDAIDEDSILKILVASDIHLGYEETTKRAQDDDSFRTFEEILQYAKNNDVDMILLGGDLFHEAKPPHNVVMRCINLLRTYCLNDKPVKIQLLTDPEIVFNHCHHKTVNYEDPNLNVGIPIFSIHGNHDDPSFGAVGSLDVLAATGFINYFGKWTDVTQVSIIPLLISKGDTTVALYGLSYMNDQRLSRLMRNDKFQMFKTDEIKDTFNIFVLHQNRAQHSKNAFISENLLPDFLDLVIWGHEHECLITPEQSKFKKNIQICQPGSSVATSLSQGESVTKHVGILHIHKTKYKMELLKLKTVRPFVFDDLILNDYKDEITEYKARDEAVEEFIDNYIENTLILQAAEQQTGHPDQPEKPLIRLRIFYNNDKDVFDTLRLSQKYYHVVANPNDIILFRKCPVKFKKEDVKKINHQDFSDIEEIFSFNDATKDWKETIQGGMIEYFNQDGKVNDLTVLSLTGLNEALSRFVNTNDTKAFNDIVRHQMNKLTDSLINADYKDKKEVLTAIKDYRNLRLQKQKEDEMEDQCFFEGRKDETSKPKPVKNDLSFVHKNFDININNKDKPKPAATRRKTRTTVKEKNTKTKTPKRIGKKLCDLNIIHDISSHNNSLNLWKKKTQNDCQISSKKTSGKYTASDSDTFSDD